MKCVREGLSAPGLVCISVSQNDGGNAIYALGFKVGLKCFGGGGFRTGVDEGVFSRARIMDMN